jgi:hypothetical protein
VVNFLPGLPVEKGLDDPTPCTAHTTSETNDRIFSKTECISHTVLLEGHAPVRQDVVFETSKIPPPKRGILRLCEGVFVVCEVSLPTCMGGEVTGWGMGESNEMRSPSAPPPLCLCPPPCSGSCGLGRLAADGCFLALALALLPPPIDPDLASGSGGVAGLPAAPPWLNRGGEEVEERPRWGPLRCGEWPLRWGE